MFQEQLQAIVGRMEKASLEPPEQRRALDGLVRVSEEVGKSWSGSWLGHHSRIYYEDFQIPPPGERFSIEWGTIETLEMGTCGEWREYAFDVVREHIYRTAGNPELDEMKTVANRTADQFEDDKVELVSILHAANRRFSDSLTQDFLEKVQELTIFTASDVIDRLRPRGTAVSRDTDALFQGHKVPPHIGVLAEAGGIRGPIHACGQLAKLARRASSHVSKPEFCGTEDTRRRTRVFLGHGRSSQWRELKDFVADRLGLPWDEFNRVPVAGITNIQRLSEMLDEAAVAFLILTAEDERADGSIQARMNVVHEAGLFQGRLGFTRSIVLLEEGCDEFSNIHGLGQIRFAQGNISSSFEEIRRVLERENLISEQAAK